MNNDYYPNGIVNKLGNYLWQYVLIAKQHGFHEVLSKIKGDLLRQITLTAWSAGLPEAQATSIIKSADTEAKEFFVVTVQEVANMLVVAICTALNAFERFHKPLSLIKAKTGWAPPSDRLKQAMAIIQKDFIQNQNPSVTILYNASRIVSFWMQYFRASAESESIWLSIYKLLFETLISKFYTFSLHFVELTSKLHRLPRRSDWTQQPSDC
ncbi:MAG: hypothetical protein ACTS45_00830 [Candidatus Hodgkinia cicadicola]